MSGSSDLVVLARVVSSLVVVIVAALLIGRFARRTGIHRAGAGADLRVGQRVAFSREAGAVLLEAGDRRLLLGVTAHQVTLLAELGSRAGSETEADPEADPDTEADLDTDADPELARASGPAGSVDASLTRRQVRQVRQIRPVRQIRQVRPVRRVRQVRQAGRAAPHRRRALPPTQRGTGSVIDPRTWQQAIEAMRDLTARRG